MSVYRIAWTPGTDDLVGTCFCGAVRVSDDPIEMWEWLLAHPDGHRAAAAPTTPPALAEPQLVGA